MRILGDHPVDPARIAELSAAVREQTLTEHVVRGLDALGGSLVDIVEQDEFTIDLVVALPDGLFLVYDTT